MTIETTGLSHIGLRVTDQARAVAFYRHVLGFQVLRELPTVALLNAHGSIIAVRGGSETPPGDRFDPFRVGLDHLALGIADPAALQGMKQSLDAAGVPNNGVQQDDFTGSPYIAFYDPDGIAWELYVSPGR
jgi:glyoxylase I family protein